MPFFFSTIYPLVLSMLLLCMLVYLWSTKIAKQTMQETLKTLKNGLPTIGLNRMLKYCPDSSDSCVVVKTESFCNVWNCVSCNYVNEVLRISFCKSIIHSLQKMKCLKYIVLIAKAEKIWDDIMERDFIERWDLIERCYPLILMMRCSCCWLVSRYKT